MNASDIKNVRRGREKSTIPAENLQGCRKISIQGGI
jgi:hypothetical protein